MKIMIIMIIMIIMRIMRIIIIIKNLYILKDINKGKKINIYKRYTYDLINKKVYDKNRYNKNIR